MPQKPQTSSSSSALTKSVTLAGLAGGSVALGWYLCSSTSEDSRAANEQLEKTVAQLQSENKALMKENQDLVSQRLANQLEHKTSLKTKDELISKQNQNLATERACHADLQDKFEKEVAAHKDLAQKFNKFHAEAKEEAERNKALQAEFQAFRDKAKVEATNYKALDADFQAFRDKAKAEATKRRALDADFLAARDQLNKITEAYENSSKIVALRTDEVKGLQIKLTKLQTGKEAELEIMHQTVKEQSEELEQLKTQLAQHSVMKKRVQYLEHEVIKMTQSQEALGESEKENLHKTTADGAGESATDSNADTRESSATNTAQHPEQSKQSQGNGGNRKKRRKKKKQSSN